MKNFNRKPIALFRQAEKSTKLSQFLFKNLDSFYSQRLEKLFKKFNAQKTKKSNSLNELKRAYPEKLKIGASISEGDCFFDSVAQGLNELNIKPGHRFTAKSLREDCENYARANANSNSWVYKKITGDAEEGGYFVGEGNLDSKVIAKERNSEDEKGISAQTDWCKGEEIITKYTEEEFFSWLLEEYREDREGKILEILKSRYGTDNDLLLEEYNEYETSKDKEEEISEDGKEKGEKVTIKPDNSNSFSKYLNNIKNMSTETNSLAIWGRPEIEGRMICEKYKVKIEVIALEEEPIGGRYITTGEEGEGDKVVRIVNYMRHFVPLLSKIPSDITENQSVSNEEIFGEVTEVPASDQSEQEEQYNIRTSKAAIAQDHKEQKTQKERINTSASEPIHTDTVITISHQQGQETQQEAIEKKLINSCYRREAIYSIAAVITAIAFTASAIAAVFTQPIPLACLAGVALAIACVCVYQLTQSHQDINELKGKVGENNTAIKLREREVKIGQKI
ncbi:OTU domain-containing protein [Wolbachia endosymbiont (group B) of Chorthippus brunneus]|uniref:hypothetical protein n=1 Tax=Wolbachia endosymbiont (group B) of Chorthippus brunneus TaxID=2953996 RepID=UPI0021F8FC8A|nr:hypothetical protein [Wolbachia endosymbiont (group B) of Chorthippus brunneus]